MIVQKEDFIENMTAQEMVDELHKIEDKMFMIDMKDHWSREDTEKYDELSLSKHALKQAIAEVSNEN